MLTLLSRVMTTAKKFLTSLILLSLALFTLVNVLPLGKKSKPEKEIMQQQDINSNRLNRVKEKILSLGASGVRFTGSKTRYFPEEERVFADRSLMSKGVQVGNRNCRKWGVLTTIFAPSEAVRRFLHRPDWCLVVVGDEHAPTSYLLPDVSDKAVFLSQVEQTAMNSSFGRKNAGFLFAVGQGADIIWDFDDDNMLKFWLESASPDPRLDLDRMADLVSKSDSVSAVTAVQVDQPHRTAKAFNPYPILGCPSSPCWPRGFPLHAVTDESTWNTSLVPEVVPSDTVGLLQSLADHEPDVDSIYRMTVGTPFSFNRQKKEDEETMLLLLPQSAFSPLNAQATLHFRKAFFALYLPVTVAGRVSDIWRSYIAQTLFHLTGLRAGFMRRPLVTQDRNPHSLEGDFAAEIPLFTQTRALLEYLEEWSVKMKAKTTEEAVEDLYVGLYEREFVEKEDVKGIQLWLRALSDVGYKLPALTDVKKVERKAIVSEYRINLNVGKSLREQQESTLLPQNCDHMSKKRFWTSDLHDGTRMDLASQLASLGQKVVLGGIKGKNLPHSALHEMKGIFFYDQFSEVLQNYNSHSSPLTEEQVLSNYDFFKTHSAIQNTDAFVCSFPASMCQLWAPFNKSIIYLPAHRYNLGRCSLPEFEQLNAWLLSLASEKKHVIGAMSRYDLEYLKYHLDVSKARLMSSLSGFYTTGNQYRADKKEVLIVESLDPAIHFQNLTAVLISKSHNLVVPLRQVYGKYELKDLVRHPAIIYLPYSVMSYKLTEFYSLGIPLFVPSPQYYRLHGGLGNDRTTSSPPYCPVGSGVMPKNPGSAHPYGPNIEFAKDPEAEMYWLQFSDFYDWPHIETFDDADDLLRKLGSVDLSRTHLGMVRSYKARQYRTLEQWCKVISTLLG